MKICVIGAGYVGLTTSTCLAELGHRVICIDSDLPKIKRLKSGKITIYEDQLDKLLNKNLNKKLFFTSNLRRAVQKSDVIFIAVGTPPKDDGSSDYECIENIVVEIAKMINGYKLIVGKSTIPVGTGIKLRRLMEKNIRKNISFDFASNPEFLREGSAVYDTFCPDRIILGVSTKKAENILKNIYKKIKTRFVVTDITTAEMIKYAANSFLAMKISFINAVAVLSQKTKSDIKKISYAVGLDKRIGRDFLNAGIGFGGFCLPKDLDAFIHTAKSAGYDFKLLKEVKNINIDMRKILIEKVKQKLHNLRDKTIGILGLAFKAGTDDIRFSPAIKIIKELKKSGALIQAFDPVASDKIKQMLPGIQIKSGIYDAADKADCLIVLTEWKEFVGIDLKKVKKKMAKPVIIDGRNIYDPELMKKYGFIYDYIGSHDA